MKILIKLSALALIGVAAVLVAGYLMIPPAATKAANDSALAAFGLPVRVGEAEASQRVSTTGIRFLDYALQSPAGFEEVLLSVGSVKVEVQTRSIFENAKDVKSFALEDVNLTLVRKASGSNIAKALAYERSDSAGDDALVSAKTDNSRGLLFRMGQVKVTRVAVRFKVYDANDSGVLFDQRLQLDDYEDALPVTEDGGEVPAAEVPRILIHDLMGRAHRAAEAAFPSPNSAPLISPFINELAALSLQDVHCTGSSDARAEDDLTELCPDPEGAFAGDAVQGDTDAGR